MKKLLLLPLAALACAFTFQSNNIKPIEIGTSLPMAETKLHDVISGKDMTLSSNKGENGLLVMFSCNTCPFVIAQQDRIIETQKNAQQMKIGVVMVNSNEAKRGDEDSEKAMKEYADAQHYLAPYVIDANSAFADAFGATRTPEAFLFDKNGKLVYHGSIDDSPRDPAAVTKHYLSDAMKAVSEGQEVATKTTVSTGCSIKRK